MKKILSVVMCLFFISAIAATVFAAGDPNWKQHLADAKDAKALKAKGNYLGAAKVHPSSACRAWYYWNYACSLVGKKDKNGRWVYDRELGAKNGEEGLRYLDIAEQNANDDDGFEGKGCDRATVLDLIAKVRSCIKGVCP